MCANVWSMQYYKDSDCDKLYSVSINFLLYSGTLALDHIIYDAIGVVLYYANWQLLSSVIMFYETVYEFCLCIYDINEMLKNIIILVIFGVRKL